MNHYNSKRSYFSSFEIESHPFENVYIPDKSKILVIGTFPTHKRNYKNTFEFFYAGEGNQFWPVIEKVFNRQFKHTTGLEAVNERKGLLTEKGIGITDMIIKCYRQNGLSQDHNIYPIVLNDIFSLLEKNKMIDTIILTSRTKIIGALGLFETYLLQQGIELPKFKENVNGVLEGILKMPMRDVEILVPYSTSKTVIENDTASLPQLVTMYKCCFT